MVSIVAVLTTARPKLGGEGYLPFGGFTAECVLVAALSRGEFPSALLLGRRVLARLAEECVAGRGPVAAEAHHQNGIAWSSRSIPGDAHLLIPYLPHSIVDPAAPP